MGWCSVVRCGVVCARSGVVCARRGRRDLKGCAPVKP
jgi:hypothetical protein